MFTGFAAVWTPVLEARQLRKKPLRVVLADVAIALYRVDGKPAALVDRCPHRGVALSLGTIGTDGSLTCPFHGWRFATDGSCVHAALNPQAKLGPLSATALPVRELGGLIWIYTASGTTAPEEPLVPEALVDPAFRHEYLEVTWRAHWSRVMENMLDMPHVPFVHRRTIGRGLRARLRPDSAIEVSFEATPTGGFIRNTVDGRPGGGFLEFKKPNTMVLHIPLGKRQMRMHVFCVPGAAGTTRLMVLSARNFARFGAMGGIFNQYNRLIVHEDRAVVESSQPAEVPPPGVEKSVASDRATLLFRKYYYETFVGSASSHAADVEAHR